MLTPASLRSSVRLLRRLATDRQGLAAIEFAFIAPLLILLFFGLTTLSSAIIAGRHTNHSASALGDLVAQCTNLNDSDIANIFSAGSDVMAPMSPSTLQQQVTSVVVTDNSGTTQVQWSVPSNGNSTLNPYTPGMNITVPAGLVANKGDTVIMSQSVYGFNFPGNVFNSGFNFDKTYYFKPRKSVQVVDTGATSHGGTNTQVSCYS